MVIQADTPSVAEVIASSNDPLIVEEQYTNMDVSWSGTASTDISVRMTLVFDGRENQDGYPGGAWCVVTADAIELLIPVVPCNEPFADADGDGDVDQDDFAVFQTCFTGTNAGPVPSEPDYCLCFDVEGNSGIPDNDIDEADLAVFENRLSAPGVPADPACGS